jgi:DNA-binding response OmpR family regulator
VRQAVAVPLQISWRAPGHSDQREGLTMKLLLAEDDVFIRRVAEVALQRDGFVVVAVTDGAQALASLLTGVFDLVVLDGMMPNMDGLSACRRIREDAALAGLPIVILGARSQNTDEASALAAGATAYIRKPFDAYALGARLREVVARHRQIAGVTA